MIHGLPAELGRAFAAGMGELHAELRLRVAVAEVDDAPEGGALRLVPEAGIPRRDARFRRGAGHLDIDQACAAHSAAAQMDKMPVARHAVDRGVLRSEEHTSELQSHSDLVCRLLLEKKKNSITTPSL